MKIAFLFVFLGALLAPFSRLDEVQKFYKSNASPAEKIEAIHVLDRLDHPEAVEALVACFDDPDFSVRQTAIAAGSASTMDAPTKAETFLDRSTGQN